MKKFFCLFVFLVLLVPIFPKESLVNITGFYGIEFGTKKEEVKKIMLSKGWTINGDDDWNISFTSGTYAGKKFEKYDSLMFSFINDKFYMAEIDLCQIYFITENIKEKINENIEWVKDLVSAFNEKYSLSVDFENEYFKDDDQTLSVYHDKNNTTLKFSIIPKFGEKGLIHLVQLSCKNMKLEKQLLDDLMKQLDEVTKKIKESLPPSQKDTIKNSGDL